MSLSLQDWFELQVEPLGSVCWLWRDKIWWNVCKAESHHLMHLPLMLNRTDGQIRT